MSNAIEKAGRPEVLTFNNLPVCYTSQLADFYQTTAKIMHNNFNRNRDKFKEEKHFFKLKGKDLIAFKRSPSKRGSVPQNVHSLIVWTKQGAARHAKMLNTEKAWEVFEALEENYFSKSTPSNSSTKSIDNQIQDCLPILWKTKKQIIRVNDGHIEFYDPKIYGIYKSDYFNKMADLVLKTINQFDDFMQETARKVRAAEL